MPVKDASAPKALELTFATQPMPPDHIYLFFERLRALNPTPRTELTYNSTFQLLVAVILSAQATDISVNKATTELFKIAPTPADIVALGEEGLTRYIRSIGLYRAKAANIVKTAQRLIEHFNGEVPDTREALETLAGVGRKTANVVLNNAFGQATMAVDTHVFRVSNRTGLAIAHDVLGVELKLLEVIPSEFLTDGHHWLIFHGRYTCKARKPLCASCPVFDVCEWPHKALFAQR